jgi:hypothetical protein
MNKYPIFVLSKGRPLPEVATTIKLLNESSLDYTIVVEPQDVQAYRAVFDRPNIDFLVLAQNDGGIEFVRQSILEEARENGTEYYWQIDDNVKAFIRKDGKEKTPAKAVDVFKYIEDLVDKYDHVALAAPQHEVIAHWATEDFMFNKGTWACVLTNTKTGINYTKGMPIIEDLDFILQHLIAGWNTIVSNKFCMVKPQSGKTKVGGLQYAYTTVYEQMIHKLLDKYPEHTKLNDRGARGINIRTAWRHFKRDVLLKTQAIEQLSLI